MQELDTEASLRREAVYQDSQALYTKSHLICDTQEKIMQHVQIQPFPHQSLSAH